MSLSEVWVSDSDSESEVDSNARAQRIAAMEARYLAGRDLFIMSASIKGELQNNPWARKRKRAAENEKIDKYYSAKKSVQSSANGTQQKLLNRTTEAGITDGTPPVHSTPLWDRSSHGAVYDNESKPTARVIDFKQYDSQAPNLLVPKTKVVRSKHDTIRESGAGLPVAVVTRSAPESLSTSGIPFPHKPSIAEATTNIAQEFTSTDTRASPSTERQARVYVEESVVGTCRSRRKIPDDAINTKIPIHEHASKTPDNVTQPDPVLELDAVVSRSIFPEVAQHTDHESSPNHVLNTQAELASARRGLQGALQMDDSTLNSDNVMMYPNSGACLEVSPIAKDDSAAVLANILEDDTTDRVPASSPRRIDKPQVNSAAMPRHEPSTPPSFSRSSRKDVSAFAQFQSPITTQNSFLTFGSPLTFSPERPVKHSASRQGRHDQTIDDIHKYLNESTFDVVDEAKRMMSDDPAILGKGAL
ncbi:protein of unknown function [Taphrina deformans PYCC 5710]|uniref:Uncharacterized protein n=1 Tax=Taphrina deformans (strain PYCC 5710 / ATCC 11124 / CBS 356.35 / IMI 108563 / JCM 9778 / NBRC 8474) TaxID=1097556 RepID=R4XFP0_TAPDE|nr:protein of unknown function [Taphrina deformans PYCC 5710]|eukprot:CCG82167.1 protein of unknown function [Taphrina deformans PYCC 5710]